MQILLMNLVMIKTNAYTKQSGTVEELKLMNNNYSNKCNDRNKINSVKQTLQFLNFSDEGV